MSENYIMIFIKTIYPYYNEINDILGYPDGFSFRVRYRQEWVAFDKPQEIIGCNGVILLSSIDPTIVIPVRKVTISEIVKIGTLTFVSVKLGDIIEFSSDPEKRSNQVKAFQLSLDEIAPKKSGVIMVTDIKDPTAELTDQEYSGDQGDRVLNSWGNLIEILGEFRCYHDFDFIKFVSLSDETGKPILPQDNPSGREYSIVPGKGYSLSVLQVIPRSVILNSRNDQGKIVYAERGNKWLELQSPSPDITLFTNRVPINSRYDIYTFRFDVKEIMSEKISAIGVAINTKTEMADKTECEIVIPVRLHNKTTWHLWRILNVIVFIAGGVILLIPDFLQNLLPSVQFASPTGGISFVQKIAIVLLVLTSWSFPKAEKWLEKIIGV